MAETQTIQLTKNNEYTVELYPINDKVQANYLGRGRTGIHFAGTKSEDVFFHVFANDENYLFVEEGFMTQTSKGVITHSPFCSVSIQSIPKERKNILENSGLIKLIKSLEAA